MGIFDKKTIHKGTAKIKAQQLYNRKQRRTKLFVILDKKGLYGKWDSKKKTAHFFHDLKDAAYYSYNDVFRIWQNMGLGDKYQIRMLHKNQYGQKVLV